MSEQEAAAGPAGLEPCPNPWCVARDDPESPRLVFWKREGFRVWCDCGVASPRFQESAEAIAAWNRRPPPVSETALVEALERIERAGPQLRSTTYDAMGESHEQYEIAYPHGNPVLIARSTLAAHRAQQEKKS